MEMVIVLVRRECKLVLLSLHMQHDTCATVAGAPGLGTHALL